MHEKHNFVQANDPTYGYWNNFSLEDFSLFWGLPNIKDSKFCYFQEVNYDDADATKKDIYPERPDIRQTIIENAEERKVVIDSDYKNYYRISNTIGLFFGYLSYLAL